MAGKLNTRAKLTSAADAAYRFEAARLDSLFGVLDAIAWMSNPTSGQIAQFAGIDPRTAGKLLKNSRQIGLTSDESGTYRLLQAYPYKGSAAQKKSVVRGALIKLPLLTALRQFSRLGDTTDDALRKAASVAGIFPFVSGDLKPLVDWAATLDALNPDIVAADLVDEAERGKEVRHETQSDRRVAFISHSSKDKPFVRQLAADLTAAGIEIWLDEQRIQVGDSIPEKIAEGLAGSDFFLIAVSEHSSTSEWVRKELNNALVREVQRRKVHVLPLKIDESPMPTAVADKKYADFSSSYRAGLDQLVSAIKVDAANG